MRQSASDSLDPTDLTRRQRAASASHGILQCADVAGRYEVLAGGVARDVQNALEQAVESFRSADLEDGGVLQHAAQDRNGKLALLRVEQLQRVVRDDPARLVQDRPRDRERLLVFLGELPVPTRTLIEVGR